MRIIAGYLGGRHFNSPRGHRTHPMSDKVRGALFNVLGDINGLSVLDPFAGSGALSFEAVSRGAQSALAIELDKGAQQAIRANIEELKLQDKVRLISANSLSWSARNQEQIFDLVLCDPPYDNANVPAITTLSKHVKPDGLLTLSWPGQAAPGQLPGFELVKAGNYGDAQLVFYRRIT